MEILSADEQKIYLTVFHDLLLWEINRLKEQSGNPAMLDYQISLLEKEDPAKYANRIGELKQRREEKLAEWKKNQNEISARQAELEVYEKGYEEIIGKGNNNETKNNL